MSGYRSRPYRSPGQLQARRNWMRLCMERYQEKEQAKAKQARPESGYDSWADVAADRDQFTMQEGGAQ